MMYNEMIGQDPLKNEVINQDTMNDEMIYKDPVKTEVDNEVTDSDTEPVKNEVIAMMAIEASDDEFCPIDLSMKFRNASVQTELTPENLHNSMFRENLIKTMTQLIYRQLLIGEENKNNQKGQHVLEDLDVSRPKISICESILRELTKIKENPLEDLSLFEASRKSTNSEDKVCTSNTQNGESDEMETNHENQVNKKSATFQTREDLHSLQSLLSIIGNISYDQNLPILDDKLRNPLLESQKMFENLPTNQPSLLKSQLNFPYSAFPQFPILSWRPFEEISSMHENNTSPTTSHLDLNYIRANSPNCHHTPSYINPTTPPNSHHNPSYRNPTSPPNSHHTPSYRSSNSPTSHITSSFRCPTSPNRHHIPSYRRANSSNNHHISSHKRSNSPTSHPIPSHRSTNSPTSDPTSSHRSTNSPTSHLDPSHRSVNSPTRYLTSSHRRDNSPFSHLTPSVRSPITPNSHLATSHRSPNSPNRHLNLSHRTDNSPYINPFSHRNLYNNSSPSFQKNIPLHQHSVPSLQNNTPSSENGIPISGDKNSTNLSTDNLWHFNLLPTCSVLSDTSSKIKPHIKFSLMNSIPANEKMSSIPSNDIVDMVRCPADGEKVWKMGETKKGHSQFEMARRQQDLNIGKKSEQDEILMNTRQHQTIRSKEGKIIEIPEEDEVMRRPGEYKIEAWPQNIEMLNLGKDKNVKRFGKKDMMRGLSREDERLRMLEMDVMTRKLGEHEMKRSRKDEIVGKMSQGEMFGIPEEYEMKEWLEMGKRARWIIKSGESDVEQESRKSEKVRMFDCDELVPGKQMKSEKVVQEFLIPLSLDEIIQCSMEEFNDILCNRNLTEEQVNVCRDLRRRGKNKIAAQNCRKRKVEQVKLLETEVGNIRSRKEILLKERLMLDREVREWQEKKSRMEEKILMKLEKTPRQWRIRVEGGRMEIVRCGEEHGGGKEHMEQGKNQHQTRRL